jgi:protein-disulfide isomerase
MNHRLRNAAALTAALALGPLLAHAASPAPTAAPDDGALEAALAALPPEARAPAPRKLLAAYAQADYVYCGRPATVASALSAGGACKHAGRQLRLAAGVADRSGATAEAVRAFVGRYYASFDRRVRIDLKAYGPPLGDEKAPVALVEYSDFTCPFCQSFRPALEAFVAAHPGRVKLYFKPFPIESHPGAIDAAIAGEWARDQGAFWPAHDALFSVEDHGLDALAGAVEELKLDPSDLRDAVTSRRLLPRVRASQEEARAAGVRGTPTLFMNGRLLELPDNGPAWLQFALEDEEEWLQTGGRWSKD